MTCHAILRDGAVVGYVCTRGRRARPCACGRTATKYCDGKLGLLNGTERSRTCNAPLCDTHATPIGDNLDLCAACVLASAPSPAEGDALIAYTDGSGTVATLPCGGGVVVFDGAQVILEASRHFGHGTNNHAEISAVRVVLAITDAPGLRGRLLVVRTDSQYTINVLTAFQGPHPEAPNARLIVATRKLLIGRRVRFEHVRGHAGEFGNERADALAKLGRLRTPGQKELPR